MKKKIIRITVFFLVLSFVAGCITFGSTTKPVSKPVAELETKLKTAQKNIDESKKAIEKVEGNVSTWEQRISTVENSVYNMQVQITANSTQVTNNNESLKSLAITAALIYIALEALKFIRALILAKIAPGSTMRNLVKGKN
ncbi:unnamed protein product [marine sediment metagenome]|uniref:Uncharacterized protein n=1 Tax=marine sediment metagenome TaxID=412755 RepID=X1D742_9ZZZZ